MIKKITVFLLCTLASISVFAQSAKVKFIKGNITDKTAAVREADDSEADWVSSNAIAFCLENKELLGNDRELDGLAVAAILSYYPESLKKQTDAQKEKLIENFIALFTGFNKSNTVQIALISKMVTLKESLPTDSFTALLNGYLKTTDVKAIDSGVFKACISALESIGNDESFKIIYGFLNDSGRSSAVSTAISLLFGCRPELMPSFSASQSLQE